MAKMKPRDKTFISITNEEIYKEIKCLHKTIKSIDTQVQATNGTVKWHTKAIAVLGGAFCSAFIYVITEIIRLSGLVGGT